MPAVQLRIKFSLSLSLSLSVTVKFGLATGSRAFGVTSVPRGLRPAKTCWILEQDDVAVGDRCAAAAYTPAWHSAHGGGLAGRREIAVIIYDAVTSLT